MRFGLVEKRGVEASLITQQDGHVCLGIYCAQCRAGIALVVLAENDRVPLPEFDWESDVDVLAAIDAHHQKHADARARGNGH